MFIRPALDPASETPDARFKVRDPLTMLFLADAGEEKPESEYWLRRLQEKGVERMHQGEPLKLTEEERAKLPALEPIESGQPLKYAVGVSDHPAEPIIAEEHAS